MNYEDLKGVTDLCRSLEICQRNLDTLAQASITGVREARLEVYCMPGPEGLSHHDQVRVDMPIGMALTLAEALLRLQAVDLKAKLAALGVHAPL
jgi:hypothetical protein